MRQAKAEKKDVKQKLEEKNRQIKLHKDER